jgi:hypothetical protein
MVNEAIARKLLELNEIPAGMPRYTRDELGYLLNILWEEEYNDSKCEAIREALVTSCMNPSWFWQSLKYAKANGIRWIFKYPFEDLPLLQRRRSTYVKVVVKWRLKIGI